MKFNDEKRLLLECALDGIDVLQTYGRNAPKGEYFSPNLFASTADRRDVTIKKLYHNNVNMLYGFMLASLTCREKAELGRLVTGKNAQEDMARCLAFVAEQLYQPSEFEERLSENIQQYSELSDHELKQNFRGIFTVDSTSILDLPSDQSIYFAKVNHGYWEYMRASYDLSYDERSQFREVGLANKIQRLKTSGLSQMWGDVIHRYSQFDARSGQCRRFCISLINGTSSIEETLNEDFTAVSRGAAVGVISMIRASARNSAVLNIGDGASTRALIHNNCLPDFFDKFIASSDACLFVVPPHLSAIDFNNYQGNVHKLIIPPARVNETWRSVLATVVGYLKKMAGEYRSISVLVQGASVASLIPMVLSDLECFQNTQIRYFDLGRVLDITTPDKLGNQGWSGGRSEEYIEEGKKVFCNNDALKAQFITLF